MTQNSNFWYHDSERAAKIWLVWLSWNSGKQASNADKINKKWFTQSQKNKSLNWVDTL